MLAQQSKLAKPHPKIVFLLSLLLLGTVGCTVAQLYDEPDWKWCGPGKGAIRGALVPMAATAESGDGMTMIVGVLLAPVGAVVGAIEGAVVSPCERGGGEWQKLGDAEAQLLKDRA